MKKVIVALSVILLGTVAAHAGSTETDFDGVYAGAQGAYGTFDAKDYGDDGAFSGGAFAGYGATFGKIYLGGEGNVDVNGYEFSKGANEGEKDWSFGVTGKAGYVINDKTLGYGLAGWEHGDVKLKDNAGSSTESADGIKVGAGMERFVYKNLSARSELSYTDYNLVSDVDASEFKTNIGVAVHF